MSEQPGQPGQPSEQPPGGPPQPPEPPPYGQAGATWPNSQPAQQMPPGQPPPYGAGQLPGQQPGQAPGGYYGSGPYIPPTPQRSNTGRIIALVVGLVLLLVCGGCVATIAVVMRAGSDLARELEDLEPVESGTPTISVGPGETFLVGDYSISEGWAVSTAGPVVTIEGMTATKVGAPPQDTVAFDLFFFRGVRLLGTATCSGSVPTGSDQAEVACTVSDRKVRRADRVDVEPLV